MAIKGIIEFKEAFTETDVKEINHLADDLDLIEPNILRFITRLLHVFIKDPLFPYFKEIIENKKLSKIKKLILIHDNKSITYEEK